jgi:uncharacterized membrane protein
MSSNFESSKLLAAIGSILVFLGFIPSVGVIIGIVGLILVLFGLKGLSEYYRDDSIYRNALSGIIFGIIGFIAFGVGGLSLFSLSFINLGFAGFIGGLIGLLLILVIVFIFFLFMALNFRKVFYTLADRSGEHLFHTAGTFLFIGAALTIIFFIGLIPLFIAWIIATVAFFSLKTSPQQSYSYPPPPSTPPPPPTATPNSDTRYCPNCGAPVTPGAAFCSHCGKQIN